MGLPKNLKILPESKYLPGKKNLISDVPGIAVGHATIKGKDVNTGVTAILPHGGNLFRDKVVAGASVINGFGKSMGLVQLDELGTIETPILMTNTLSIGTAFTALAKYMLADNPDIGVSTGTVNCIVTECNDGKLNDIRGLHVTEEHVLDALRNCDTEFEEGAVGGGTGMCCMGLKGGIGSSSRIIQVDGSEYVIGTLVMSNFGEAGNLILGGKKQDIEKINRNQNKDNGSIIMIIATDLPMSSRQLHRVSKRAAIGLGRTGSFCGNGSGDIAIAFTTANRIPHYSGSVFLSLQAIRDDRIDVVFEAVVESIEESIVSSLYHADTTDGIRGGRYYGLRDFI